MFSTVYHSQFAALPSDAQGVEAEHLRERGAFLTTDMQLTTSQQKQLDGWIEEVREHEHGAMKFAKALFSLHESGLWKFETDNWAEFCEEHFAFSKDKSYRYIRAARYQIADETISERLGLPCELKTMNAVLRVKPAKVADVQPLIQQSTQNNSTSSKAVSAKLVPDGEIQYAKPPPMPLTFRQEVAELVKLLDGLLMGDQGFALSQKFRHAVALAKKIQHEVQGELPGMAEHFPKFKAPTLEEVQFFCAKSGIVARDGEWFWNKMEGSGWKNDGKPVVSWQRTMIQWKIHGGILPSSKNVGNPVKSLASKEWDKMLKESERL